MNIEAIPTTGAREFGGNLIQEVARMRQLADQKRREAYLTEMAKRDRILGGITNFRQSLQRREDEANADSGAWGGAAGAGTGAILGAALAIPTGGLSIPAGAALGASVGGGVGSAVDAGRRGQPADFGAPIRSGVSTYAALDEIGREEVSEFYLPRRNAGGGQGGGSGPYSLGSN